MPRGVWRNSHLSTCVSPPLDQLSDKRNFSSDQNILIALKTEIFSPNQFTPPGKPRCNRDNIKHINHHGMDWSYLAHNSSQWRAIVKTVTDLHVSPFFQAQRLVYFSPAFNLRRHCILSTLCKLFLYYLFRIILAVNSDHFDIQY
jgi:hypothetical protein